MVGPAPLFHTFDIKVFKLTKKAAALVGDIPVPVKSNTDLLDVEAPPKLNPHAAVEGFAILTRLLFLQLNERIPLV